MGARSKGMHVKVARFTRSRLNSVMFIRLPRINSRLDTGRPFKDMRSMGAISRLCTPLDNGIIRMGRSLGSGPRFMGRSPCRGT